MRKVVFLKSLFLLLCWGCQDETNFRTYTNLNNGWNSAKEVVLELPEIKDGNTSHNLYFYVRNNNEYEYANIFIIATLKLEHTTIFKDTLEYAMAAPDGSWLGKGFLEVKESKLWWKEGFNFETPGSYTVTLNQAMRKNQAVNGVANLKGIVALGIEMEPIQEIKQ